LKRKKPKRSRIAKIRIEIKLFLSLSFDSSGINLVDELRSSPPLAIARVLKKGKRILEKEILESLLFLDVKLIMRQKPKRFSNNFLFILKILVIDANYL